jgi:hypothetical protein
LPSLIDKIGVGAMVFTSSEMDVTYSDVSPAQVSRVLFEDIAVGGHWGEFHSKFKNCVNGIFDDRSFFNICSDRVWINPRSIQITDEAWNMSRMGDINPGDRCGLVGHVLYIPILSIRMDLKKALLWDAHLEYCPGGVCVDRIVRNFETIKLVQRGREDRFIYPPRFKETLNERTLNLERSIADGSESSIKEAITSLIGFGPGLTPTGDDFLTGIMAILHMMEKIGHHNPYGNKIFDFITHSCIGKTSIFGEQMLLDGASGQFALPIAKLMKDLVTRDNEDLLRGSIDDLLGVGANSGFDVLNGTLWAMEVFLLNVIRRG